MKVLKTTKKVFQPTTLHLEIENQAELNKLKRMLGNARKTAKSNYDEVNTFWMSSRTAKTLTELIYSLHDVINKK